MKDLKTLIIKPRTHIEYTRLCVKKVHSAQVCIEYSCILKTTIPE